MQSPGADYAAVGTTRGLMNCFRVVCWRRRYRRAQSFANHQVTSIQGGSCRQDPCRPKSGTTRFQRSIRHRGRLHHFAGRPSAARRCASGYSARRLRGSLHCGASGRKLVKPFRYFDKGNMAVVGKNFAIMETSRIRLSGFVSYLAWALIHVMFLPQVQNRMRVQTQWMWTYFTGQRGSRIIGERATVRESRTEVRLAAPVPVAISARRPSI